MAQQSPQKQKMKIHPYAEMFPMASEHELEDMSKDIKKRGLLNPIITMDGAILDGRNRFEACQRCGVAPRYEEYQGRDALGDVLSWNLHRRQLSTSQRAIVASRFANMTRHDASTLGVTARGIAPTAEIRLVKVSSTEAAKMLNVSTRIVEQARSVQREAPELVKEIESGKITVGKADKEIRMKREEAKAFEQMRYTGDVGKTERPKDTDSATLYHLKRYWGHASKKDKQAFKEWISK